MVEEMECIDHLSESYEDNRISNLVFCTRAENSKKSLELRPRSRRAQGKPIEQWTLKGTLVIVHDSLHGAAKSIPNANYRNISACANGKRQTASGFKWRYQEVAKIEGEEWRTSRYNPQIFKYMEQQGRAYIQVSNMGRIKVKSGRITKGTSFFKPYRKVGNMMVHHYVMLYFGDHNPLWNQWLEQKNRPPSERHSIYILHNDNIPRDVDGCFSNTIDDLRLGTPAKNAQECSQIGTRKIQNASRKRKRENYIAMIAGQQKTGRVLQKDQSTGEVIKIHDSVSSASKFIEKGRGNIQQCCDGLMNNVYGYHWEWEMHSKRHKSAIHAHRVTIMPKDMQLARRIRGERS